MKEGRRRSLGTRAHHEFRAKESPKENAFGVVSRTWPAFRPSSPSSPPPLPPFPPSHTRSLSLALLPIPRLSLPSTLPSLVALFRRCEIQCQRRRARGTGDGAPNGWKRFPYSARAVVYLPRLSLLRSNGQRCRLPMALPAPLQRVGEKSPLSRLRSPSKIGRRYGDRKSRRRR